MHSVEELGTNVPAFLAKLWKIVEDPETNDLICWNPGGSSFYIRNQARFARELLPLYYKHNNMASFVRQLNMYGFHKVVSIDGGGLKVDKDEMEFAHQYFIMGHPYLLEHIKRKIPTSKVEEGRTNGKPEMMSKVLADVKSMKGRQDSLDSQLSAMKRENEVLWREVAILRQKHLKQQQIVNKLIQFLVTMVQSSRNGGIGIKRHYPLMLNDTSHRPAKSPKVGPEISDLNSGPNTRSPTGPVIHELDTAELLEDCGANAEPTATEVYLPSDFCSVVIDNEQNEADNANTSEIVPDSPSTANNPNPEVLLDLAEECPLSPSMLLTASPLDVNPAIITPRLSKGKNRSRLSSFEGKKRRSKRGNASSKIIAETSTRNTAPKATSITPEEESLANGVNLLDVLPTLVNDKNVSLLEKNTEDIEADAQNVLLTPDPLAVATNEAISAISSVAAASKKELSKSATSQDSRNISLPTMNDILSLSPDPKGRFGSPVLIDSNLADSDANSNKSLSTNDLLVFKQEPSTSNDKRTSPSNMVLACTGNSDDSIFKRDELDCHVDTVQSELDSLRELLKGEGYSLDANTLLGLFSDDPLASAFDDLPGDREKGNSAGSELATYSSNLLDMVDMFENPEADQWSSPSTPESSNIMDVSLSELNTPQMSVVSPGSVSKKLK
ncbi:heat shock factor protein isoform X2 [Periplaneta americana]|uniref:heat shock factor protein isoform X2 n=1 Tax=Periplaneta americana TaxID=6978 RepID=UPI0037E8E6B6